MLSNHAASRLTLLRGVLRAETRGVLFWVPEPWGVRGLCLLTPAAMWCVQQCQLVVHDSWHHPTSPNGSSHTCSPARMSCSLGSCAGLSAWQHPPANSTWQRGACTSAGVCCQRLRAFDASRRPMLREEWGMCCTAVYAWSYPCPHPNTVPWNCAHPTQTRGPQSETRVHTSSANIVSWHAEALLTAAATHFVAKHVPQLSACEVSLCQPA